MAKKKNPIPKKIAGLKVPKMLRKSRLLRTMLASATGREILANALTAGAAAAAAVLVKEREEVAEAGKKGARKGAHAIAVGTEAVQSAASAAMGVVAEAADQILPGHRSRRAKRDGGEEAPVTH
ncbi:hypothetical protein [Chelativorans sp.]|uniref:hypothetical protein n=1 Tax=Chelativorans sp. TaxID=2203393 RepID=UPI0028128CFB|nr:hypothetical protein [Chelativorans sp.]